MNQLISLMPRAEEPPAFPCFTNLQDVQDLNRLVALFNADRQPISQRQLDGLAHLFVSKTTPSWVRTRAQHFRFPSPACTCVPAALAMECVEDMVASELEDFLDYWSLRTSLAHRFGLEAEAFDFSVEDWCSFRCHQQQERRGMGSFLTGAYLPKPPLMFSVN